MDRAESVRGRQPGARYALVLCTSIYFLSYVDRMAPQSVKEDIINDFGLKDSQSALPTTCANAVYPIAAVIAGWMVDTALVDCRTLLTIALVVWSVCTALTAFSQHLGQLILLRMFVYAGEAAFAAIAFPLLADFYPKRELTAMYGILMLGMPLGVSAGFAAGGVVGSAFGWRAALCLCGVPGLVLSCFVPRMTLPSKSTISERAVGSTSGPRRVSLDDALQEYCEIFSQPHWLVAISGGALLTFGLSIAAEWVTVYYIRYADSSLEEATLMMSLRTLFGAGLATLLFSRLAQHYSMSIQNINFLVPAVFTIPGVAFAYIENNTPQHKSIMYSAAFAGSFFQYSFNGPMTAVMMQAIRPELRGRAFSAWLAIQRIFDMVGPLAAGIASDHVGLRTAMQIIWMVLLATDLCWWAGYMLTPLKADQEVDKQAATTYYSLLFEASEAKDSRCAGVAAASEKSHLCGNLGQKTHEYASVP
mmetsp:Transcript_106836/g.276200  ORF Transcript_106836/g.276200 Transcript_106836/m.276200 type:complete len:476 (-) Transcript_106836:16-1443(-)